MAALERLGQHGAAREGDVRREGEGPAGGAEGAAAGASGRDAGDDREEGEEGGGPLPLAQHQSGKSDRGERLGRLDRLHEARRGGGDGGVGEQEAERVCQAHAAHRPQLDVTQRAAGGGRQQAACARCCHGKLDGGKGRWAGELLQHDLGGPDGRDGGCVPGCHQRADAQLHVRCWYTASQKMQVAGRRASRRERCRLAAGCQRPLAWRAS
mmetsp:Transcript_42112/g.137366  ORF Transcript_42112/g.137366 Transcript_42112/m.137366 type:complete len:211 (+) Transcript_42112:172-804(+)